MKLTYLSIFVLCTCFLSNIECHAQNNPFKINDRLYSYFLKLDANIQSDDALKMADTLFNMAKEENDLKTQCIALYTKARHYHTVRDMDNEIKVFHQVSPFIRKTPYLQYYFGMWSNIIVRHTNDNNIPKALTEIMAYRKEAQHLKNNYGILQSYILQANNYLQSNHFRLAKVYYLLALDYADKVKISDNSNLLNNLSRCCFYLSDWKDCKKYIDLIMLDKTKNSFSTRNYALLLSYDCNQIPIDSAKVEEDYQLLIRYQKENPILRNDYFLFREAMYYYYLYYKKDTVEAAKHIMSTTYVPEYFDFKKKAYSYELQKDYKQSATCYKQYVDCIRNMNAMDEQYLIDEFVPQLDLYNLDHEKNELRKRNESLKLEELKKKQDILLLTEQQNEGRLITNQRERGLLSNQLIAQSESIAQQNRLLKIKKMQNDQHRKASMLVEEQEKWQTWFGLITVIALFTIMAFYTIEKLLKRKRLKEEKEKAEKSNYIKSLFFQNMNHEIRTPLNAISGFNDLLNSDLSGAMPTEEKKELINMISINSNLLTTLVNDVIDLSNFESGSYKLNLANVDINSVCNTAVESIRGQQKEGVKLAFETTGDNHPTLYTDAQRLQQVLTNYLTNACKHTDSGSIILAYESNPDFMKFSVTDTGCGIKEEDAEKVFERFEMLKTNRNGTGLGLHICRIIANLLHGKVYLDTVYKKGARFIFEHPIVKGLLLLLSLSPLQTIAKNEFGINDKLYALYRQMENEFNPSIGHSVANKMYAMAVKMNDKRGKCVAVNAHNYFYKFSGDENKMLYTLNQCKQLSIEANFYRVLYDSWTNVIAYYLENNNTEAAKRLLGDMIMMARKHNDPYGFGAYYYEAANYYLVQRLYAAAIFYYLQSLGYKNVDFNTVYLMTGQCYFKIGNYSKAVEYCEKSLIYKHNDASNILPLMMLETCYYKLGKPDKAKEAFEKLRKIDEKNIPDYLLKYYHSGLYSYYHFIAKDKEKAEAEEKLSHNARSNYDWGEYLFDQGDYEEACKQFKEAADAEEIWLTSDYKDLNNFYIGKFDYKESERDKEILELNAMNLKVKESQNNHQLLMLKQENSIWQLHQDKLIAKSKQSQLRLQKILLDKKRSEYQKQSLAEQGLIQQNKMIQSNLKWKGMTIAVAVIFVLICVFIFVNLLRKTEKKLLNDTRNAKEDEERKNLFYNSINHQIHEPIETIIRLNHKLNADENITITDSERKHDVRELDNKTMFLTEFINDVLIISKLESGTYEKKEDVCTCDTLCRQSISSMKSQKLIAYKPDSESEQPFISDSQMIQWVITSFLKYALNSISDNATITLASANKNNRLTISVTFPGNPMHEDEARHIFEFGKNSNNQIHEEIGLYKSKLVARLLNGEVYADTAYNQGRRLVFEMTIQDNPS